MTTLWIRDDGRHYHLSSKCPFVDNDYQEVEVDEDEFWRTLVWEDVGHEIMIKLEGVRKEYLSCPACVIHAVTRFLVNEACIDGYIPPRWE